MLLIGQVWVSTAPYCVWLNDEAELVELLSKEKSESEEEDNEKEKDLKIQMEMLVSKFIKINKKASAFDKANLLTSSHIEIISPPPEAFQF